jgi:hypothetical protein
MEGKSEGPVWPPLPLLRRQEGEAVRPRLRLGPEAGEARCEMCGAPVIATHCKRICLKCGFMTGCSEGI